jgi:hypothetical protein
MSRRKIAALIAALPVAALAAGCSPVPAPPRERLARL